MNSYKQNKRPLQPITYLLSVLFLFTLALPQPVFASTAHTTVVSDNPTPTPTVPPDPGFVQAKGAVVRLLVSYTDPTDKTVANCTGLGILIKSLSPSSGTPNDWVLTDGVLLDKAQAMCATDHPVGTLSQVQIYFNTANTGKTRMIQVDSASNPPVSNAITCSDPKNCSNGPALIAFHGEQVPFVDLATVSSGTPPSPIGLTDHEGTVNIPPSSDQDSEKYTETIKGFLIPQPVDARNAANKLEAGTPLLDSKGHLTNLHLSSDGATFNLNAATSLIAQTDNNPLPTPTPTPVPQQTSGSFIVLPVLNISLDIWQFIILVIVLLAVLLFVGLFIRSRAQQHHPSFKADLDEAKRYAASVAQEIEAMETKRKTRVEQNVTFEQPTVPPQQQDLSDKPTVPPQQQGLQDKTVMHRTRGDLVCPQCSELVTYDANFCPNCGFILSPLEPDLHSRVRPLTPSAQSPIALKPRVEFDTADIRADINARQLMEQESGEQE